MKVHSEKITEKEYVYEKICVFSPKFLWKSLFPSRERAGIVRRGHFVSSRAELNEPWVVFLAPLKNLGVSILSGSNFRGYEV